MPSEFTTPENPADILPDRPTTGNGHLAPGDTAGSGPELLTLPQVAALCGVSPRTLWGWAESGVSPPALRISRGCCRYSRRAFLRWIDGGCRPLNGGPER